MGWEEKAQLPSDPRGLHEASDLALQRWQDDERATGITFYEDISMAWKSDHMEPEHCMVAFNHSTTSRCIYPESASPTFASASADGSARGKVDCVGSAADEHSERSQAGLQALAFVRASR